MGEGAGLQGSGAPGGCVFPTHSGQLCDGPHEV